MTARDQSARAVLDKAMDEDSLLQAIVEAALFLGWRVHHDRRSDKALQQGSPGFPDLCLVKMGRVLFIECKNAKENLTDEQFAWLFAFGWRGVKEQWHQPTDAAVRAFLLRPADLDAALAELARP